MHRLAVANAKVYEYVTACSDKKLRELACVACRAAVASADVSMAEVSRAIDRLFTGELLVGDSAARLQELVEQLDTKYADLQNAANQGMVIRADYVSVFRQARAVASVVAANNSDPLAAAVEAIYEAAAAVERPTELWKVVLSV